MPYYEYQCQDCRRRGRLFMTYAEYGRTTPTCPHCHSAALKRRIGRVALGKSEDARMDSMLDDSALANLDENDPKALGHFMRKMSREMGEDLGDEFSEVVDRLESGESPESIEKSMPDLGAADGGMDF
ncbi:MAG TPA: zinc ribbon domain-containing protein [Chloroflexota bacterium]|nr:zinc ribbon domain-containing protein [Chloroflexota bacterium]